MPILQATRCEAWLSRSVTATTRRRPPASASSRMARAAPSPSRGRCERRRRRRHSSIDAASGAGCAVRQRDVGRRRRTASSCRSSWGQRGRAADAPQERDGLGAISTGPNSMSDVRTRAEIRDEDRNRKGGQESRKGTGTAEGDEMCTGGRRSQEGRCRGVRRTSTDYRRYAPCCYHSLCVGRYSPRETSHPRRADDRVAARGA